MARNRNTRPHGQVRRSQVIGQYGPGAMVDLPRHAVIIGGLESWGDPTTAGFQPVTEERLRAKLAEQLEMPSLRLYAPPIDLEFGSDVKTGITAWEFPEWFVAQHDRKDGTRARPIVHQRQLDGGKWRTPDRKRSPVVPIRFVQACVQGHISDIDWRGFAHHGEHNCQQQLWLLERGTSGDFLDIFVECECKKFPPRTLFEATKSKSGEPPLGFCRGKRPWLGANASEECKGENGTPQPNRLLVRSASNSYFALVASAISIPDRDAALQKAVDLVWDDFLMFAEEPSDITRDRRKAKVQAALADFTDEQVWKEVQRRKSETAPPPKGIKQAELETLLASRDEVGDDSPSSDFYARALAPPKKPSRAMALIDRVVLVHRLREVVVQVGFTRFEAPSATVDGELDLDVKSGALAREASWLPAVENHGEGIFLALKTSAVAAWQAKKPVQERFRELNRGFELWRNEPGRKDAKFAGLPYVLLHSLSHLLISAVSLECGYSASSIRERIYATPAGYGILLHTGTPDAEGTLGGLIQVGRRMDEMLQAALDLGRLCSNDPVCAQHQPDHPHDDRHLHGAACHGCLLISEPSCERRNELLDRALVIPTVAQAGAEFFEDAD